MPTPTRPDTASNEVRSLPSVEDDVVIDRPTMFRPWRINEDVDVLPAYLPVPGLGVLAAQSYVVHGDQPVLVDTGPGGLPPGAYEEALRSVVDPARLRWLWLTHTDPDHVGALGWLLDAAPELRVVTSFLGLGKLSLFQPVPIERCHFANPGDAVHMGDRTLVALRPPTYDAPETTACYDTRTGVLFSADAFGAVLPQPARTAERVPADVLGAGLVLWSTVDAPWVHQIDRGRFGAALADVARLEPGLVASSHLPPATEVAPLLELTSTVPAAPPWQGPDQAALESMLAAAGA